MQLNRLVRTKNWSRLRPGNSNEEGQSLMEMTIGLIFLLAIVLALFEMATLFYAYISLLNASREGAVYASSHTPSVLVSGSPSEEQLFNVTTVEADAAGLNTDAEFFLVDPPETPEGSDPLDPIIVSVHYKLVNPTNGIVLPMLGRMGLFQSTWIDASTEMPIR